MRVHGRRKLTDIAGRLGDVFEDEDQESYYERHKADDDDLSPSPAHTEYNGMPLTLPNI